MRMKFKKGDTLSMSTIKLTEDPKKVQQVPLCIFQF